MDTTDAQWMRDTLAMPNILILLHRIFHKEICSLTTLLFNAEVREGGQRFSARLLLEYDICQIRKFVLSVDGSKSIPIRRREVRNYLYHTSVLPQHLSEDARSIWA